MKNKIAALVLMSSLIAAPAVAQRDSLKMGEALGTAVIKKDVGAVREPPEEKKPAAKNPTVKETLAIEHKTDAREKKETK